MTSGKTAGIFPWIASLGSFAQNSDDHYAMNDNAKILKTAGVEATLKGSFSDVRCL